MALTTIAALRTYLAQPADWTQSTAYVLGDQCRANSRIYICIAAGTSSGTGTGPATEVTDVTDGTVHWKFLGPGISTDNATLTRLITAVGAFFSQYCDRTFESASYTYVTSGHGGTMMLLPEYPVSAVSSVTIDGVTIPQRPSVGAAGWVLMAPNQLGLDGSKQYPVYTFTKGMGNVTVAYTAGYSSIPYDLEQAALESCASWYKRRARVDEESKNIQGEVINFTPTSIPRAAREVLDLYRRSWPR